ncbi:MAG TPA: RING finger protein [Acidobacteriota bacterium]
MAVKRFIKIHSLESDICPYCRSTLSKSDDLVICKSCKTIHHQSCWNTNHRCSVFGCSGKKSLRYGNNKKSRNLKQAQPNRSAKIGRNDPCPCNSDLKYKDCCLKKVEQGITIFAPGKGGSGRRVPAAFETYVGKKSR